MKTKASSPIFLSTCVSPVVFTTKSLVSSQGKKVYPAKFYMCMFFIDHKIDYIRCAVWHLLKKLKLCLWYPNAAIYLALILCFRGFIVWKWNLFIPYSRLLCCFPFLFFILLFKYCCNIYGHRWVCCRDDS